MAMTYSSLKTDIQTWAENTGTDFNNQLDTFIDNTFDSLSRDIDPIGFKENVTTTAVAGDRFVNLPTSIEPMLFNYLTITVGSNVSYLELKTLAFCQEYWPDISLQNQPKYFANFDDDRVYLAPTPDQNYTLKLGYQGKINPLSNTNTTNWYTENISDVLLFGCLAQANLFTKNLEDYTIYTNLYNTRVATVNNEARRRRRTDYKFPGSPVGTNTLTGGQ